MEKKVVIIGAVAAGTKVAAKLKRDKPDFEVKLYTQEDIVAYSACGLPYFVEGSVPNINNLIIRTPEQFREQGVEVFLQTKAMKILRAEKKVVFNDLKTGASFEESYDKLVIATGSRPFVPDIENVQLGNVFTMRTLSDGLRIKDAMVRSKRVVIVGAGYIGVELLEAFVANGLEVVVLEAGNQILPLFDVEFSELIKVHIHSRDEKKVGIITGDYAVSFEGEDGVVKNVVTKNGLKIDCDMVILSVGVVPNTELAVDCGLELGLKNTIKVNPKMLTSDSDIYAVGDCAQKYHIVSHRPCWIPLGSTANKEGRVCALNLQGVIEEFPGVLGSAVTRYFGFTMSICGLTEREARLLGYDVVSAIVTKKDRAGYMPEVGNITLKLVVDKVSRKVLGIQGIGCGDVDKKVNTVASSMQANGTIDDFLHVDLPYAPPYSTSVDPLHNAASIIYDKLAVV